MYIVSLAWQCASPQLMCFTSQCHAYVKRIGLFYKYIRLFCQCLFHVYWSLVQASLYVYISLSMILQLQRTCMHVCATHMHVWQWRVGILDGITITANTATYCNKLQHTSVPATAQHTAINCNALPYPSRPAMAQHTATHCNALQHTATHCNALQHTATHLEASNGASVFGGIALRVVEVRGYRDHWMSHGTHENETYRTYEWVIALEVRGYRDQAQWVVSKIWIRHNVTHKKQSCRAPTGSDQRQEECVNRGVSWDDTLGAVCAAVCRMAHIRSSHGKHMNESWHTYEWVMAHTWISHGTHMD